MKTSNEQKSFPYHGAKYCNYLASMTKFALSIHCFTLRLKLLRLPKVIKSVLFSVSLKYIVALYSVKILYTCLSFIRKLYIIKQCSTAHKKLGQFNTGFLRPMKVNKLKYITSFQYSCQPNIFLM